ncbi:MAG: hypothetical protein FJ299_14185 [Planctomycetes bacterium]|nr:hypothetical protein [Planctomycetota bacterium]
MNRTTALLLTLALLFAHVLAIYHDPEGGFGPPCDDAHVVYRVGRNAALEGEACFDPTGPRPEQAVPLAWRWIAQLNASRGSSPLAWTQTLSLLFGLACVVALAGFSTNRLAGLIAPVLLVLSGSLAATCGDGTPTTAYAFVVTFAFLAFHRRWSLATGLALAVAASLRDEALLYVGVLVLLDWHRGNGQRLRWHLAFGLPALTGLLLALARQRANAGWFSPELASVFEPDPQRWRLGAHYLLDHARLSGLSLLALAPLAMCMTGRISRAGLEALLLAVLGILLVAAQGGSPRPFGIALVPMLPLLCLSIQESLQAILDHERRWREAVIWVLLVIGAAWTALPSKLPGDVAFLPTRSLFLRWVQPSQPVQAAWGRMLGRRGLELELAQTRQLRAIGLYFRDRIPADTRVLTAWPGAIAYLSHRSVRDLLGRISPAAGESALRPWTGAVRIDLAAALRERHDYIVLPPEEWREHRGLEQALTALADRFDKLPRSQERDAELAQTARDYELVTVPVPRRENVSRLAGNRVQILRLRKESTTPRLTIARDDHGLVIELLHHGPPVVADLVVEWTNPQGVRRLLRPWGGFEQAEDARARVGLLLTEAGSTVVELARADLPREFAQGHVRALLCDPAPAQDGRFAVLASAERDL